MLGLPVWQISAYRKALFDEPPAGVGTKKAVTPCLFQLSLAGQCS